MRRRRRRLAEALCRTLARLLRVPRGRFPKSARCCGWENPVDVRAGRACYQGLVRLSGCCRGMVVFALLVVELILEAGLVIFYRQSACGTRSPFFFLLRDASSRVVGRFDLLALFRNLR